LLRIRFGLVVMHHLWVPKFLFGVWFFRRARVFVLRAHVSRRGGRRTRTLVQAVYGRGSQPVAYPREQKSRRGYPGRLCVDSFNKPLHSRLTTVILALDQEMLGLFEAP